MPDNIPSKPRNRRQEAAKKRAVTRQDESVRSAGQRFLTFIGIMMLVGFAAVIFYALFIFDAEDLRRFNQAYAVLDKQRIEGELIESNPEPGAPSKGFSKRLDPKFQVTCLADFTRSQYIFEVPESVYRGLSIHQIVPASDTRKWVLLSYDDVSLKSLIEKKTGLDLGD